MTTNRLRSLTIDDLAAVTGGAGAAPLTFNQRFDAWTKATAGKSPAELLRLPAAPTR